jgi:hypothetical protein
MKANILAVILGALDSVTTYVITYVKTGLVIAFNKFTSSDTTILDTSTEGNDAYLYTGIGTSFDGAGDQAQFPAFANALPAVPARIVGKARSSTDTSVPLTLNALNPTASLVADGTWQEVVADFSDLAANSDNMWFDGETTKVTLANGVYDTLSTGSVKLNFLTVVNTDCKLFSVASPTNITESLALSLYNISGSLHLRVGTNSGGVSRFAHTVNSLELNRAYEVILSSDGDMWKISIDGLDQILTVTVGTNDGTWFSDLTDGPFKYSVGCFNRSSGDSQFFNGLLFDLVIHDGISVVGQYSGTELITWTDTSGNGNNGTVNGSPQTVSQYLRNPSSYSIGLGFNGDLSDIRIQDAFNNNLHRVLQIAPTVNGTGDSLNRLPVVDSVNGNHGVMAGGSSFDGEGVDPDVRAIPATLDDKMWFDGVDDYVELGSAITLSGAFDISFMLYLNDSNPHPDVLFGKTSSQDHKIFVLNGSLIVRLNNISSTFTTGFTSGAFYSVTISRNASNLINVTVDGVSKGTVTNAATGIYNRIGRDESVNVNNLHGLLYDIDFNGTLWDGTIADGDAIGTVNGSPVTVGQKRATIMQTAGLDFNASTSATYAASVVVNTANPGATTSTQFAFRGQAFGVYDCVIDWGDGSSSTISSEAEFETLHDYGVTGTYTITITGEFGGFRFNDGGDNTKVISCETGNAEFYTDGFFGCSNLETISFKLAEHFCKETDFESTWRKCSSIIIFPFINTSNGSDFSSAWFGCSSIIVFPLIDTSSGERFNFTWSGCSSMIIFPLIDTSSGEEFNFTWSACSSIISFPLLDVSSGRDFSSTWRNCSSMKHFPANFFDNWNPASLTSGIFDNTWDKCSSLTSTSVENILTSLDTSGIYGTDTGLVGGTTLADNTIDIDYDSSGLTGATTTAIANLKTKAWQITINGQLQ